MAISLVAHTGRGNVMGGSITTTAIDTSGADFIALVVGDYTTGEPTITDSKSNVWLKAGRLFNLGSPGFEQLTFDICYPTSVGASHTFTTTGTLPGIAVAAFSGLQKQYGILGVNSGTSLQPVSIPLAESVGLILSAITWGSSATPAIDDSFTISDQIAFFTGVSQGIALAYRIVASGTHAPSWTWTGATGAVALTATFNETGSSSSSAGGSYGFA
jgi:hypothetical protein